MKKVPPWANCVPPPGISVATQQIYSVQYSGAGESNRLVYRKNGCYRHCNIIFAFATFLLAFVTFLALHRLGQQVSFARSQSNINRLNEEMTKLVAPLMLAKVSELNTEYLLGLNRSSFAPDLAVRDYDVKGYYYEFWDNIKIHMYLGPDYLWTELYKYFKLKDEYYSKKHYNIGGFDKTEAGRRLISDFEGEKQLLEIKINQRYFEIKNELLEKTKKINKPSKWQQLYQRFRN